MTGFRRVLFRSGYLASVNPAYEFALNYLLVDEGTTLENVQFDTGGTTKFGVIVDDLVNMGYPNACAKNIADLTVYDAKYIYRKLYWNKLNLDSVKDQSIATALFDIGVVRGIGVIPHYLQQMYNTTDITIVNSQDVNTFLDKFKSLCDLSFHQIVEAHPTDAKFLQGWLNRSARLLTLKK